MGFTIDSAGFPVFNNDITDPTGQFQAAADVGKKYAFRLAGTRAARLAIPNAQLRPGLEFYETDTQRTWVYFSGSWVTSITGTITQVSGTSLSALSTLDRIGNKVHLHVNVTKTASGWNVGNPVCTIPAGLAPGDTTAVFGALTSGGNNGMCVVYIGTDGSVNISGYVTNSLSKAIVFDAEWIVL